MAHIINRRGFLTLTGAVGAAAALAACSGPGSGSSGGGGVEGDANTINFWSNHPGKSQEFEKELISRFQAQNPGLTVNLIDGGKNYEEVSQKFNAALSGNDVPTSSYSRMSGGSTTHSPVRSSPSTSTSPRPGSTSRITWIHFLPITIERGATGLCRTLARPRCSTTTRLSGRQPACPIADRPRGRNSTSGARASRAVVGNGKLAHGWGNAVDYLGWTFEGPIWTFGGSYSDQFELKFDDPNTIAAGKFLQDMIHTKKYAAAPTTLPTTSPRASSPPRSPPPETCPPSPRVPRSISVRPSCRHRRCARMPHRRRGSGHPGQDLRRAQGERASKFIDFVTNGANTAY